MYQFSYAQTQRDSGAQARQTEAGVLQRITDLLKAASDPDASPQTRIDALHQMRRFWMALIDDLATPGNALPQETRASLISIGLSLLREADQIDIAGAEGFSYLAEINTLVLTGLA